MKVQFKYAAPHLRPANVAVIGSFNDYNWYFGQMRWQGDGWYLELDLPPGEYYYKYLINNAIRINDPDINTVCPHDKKGLYTPLFIDTDGSRSSGDETSSAQVDSYTCGVSMDMEPECKEFQLNLDSHMVIRLGFTEVVGFNAVTALWYNPSGKLHSVVEKTLHADDVTPGQPCYLLFWMDLNNPWRDYPLGDWTVKILINGQYIFEDNLTLLEDYPRVFYGCDVLA